MTSLRRREAKSKKSERNITRISCFYKNEITACIADLFNSFCEEVYAFVFHKVMQQQTIGEVASAITRLWADKICLQQWNNY